MKTLKFTLFVIFGFLFETTLSENVYIDKSFSLKDSETGFGWDLLLTKDGAVKTLGKIGHTVKNDQVQIIKNNGVSIYNQDFKLDIKSKNSMGLNYLHINWRAVKSKALMDCLDLGNAQWYGGPQQKQQYWPIQKLKFDEYSYVSKEADNAAIAEPYWLSSEGVFLYVDKVTPLFVDQNNKINNSACFIANIKAPYSVNRKDNKLSFWIGYGKDAKFTHRAIIESFLGKPKGLPDYRMVQHPIWSTWAEYKRPINESIVMDFAEEILEHGFNNSQIEIDDLWEVCYGSLTVDKNRFPDLKRLNLKLKEMGFRVTIWIHPFINKGCEPWYSEALSKGYLVKNEEGKVETSWWNDNGTTATYIDFTNEAAAKWWVDRLIALQKDYEIDSFKFDAGETSWSPQVPVQNGLVDEHPSHITRRYVQECAKFGPMVEVRSGVRTQDLPIFVRMIDKDSEWTFENGLPTLVTTLLQMNMNGYPLVLPDMIGGNGYNDPPSKEMFIRWLQANTFMPSLQYSYVPWDYDNETIRISHKFTDIHANYTDVIYEAINSAVLNGDPVNPPIWWSDPNDKEAQKIWDEYMLGESILVAPVMIEGAQSRDVYLPRGTWLTYGDSSKIEKGPKWIKNFSAPLDVLPYFVKDDQAISI